MSRAHKVARSMREMERIGQGIADLKWSLRDPAMAPELRERAERSVVIEESMLDRETDKYLKLLAGKQET